MKKVFVLTFVMMMFCAAKAQKGLEDFTYGIKGGWNISNVSNVDYGGIDGKNKMSFHLGVFAEWRMGDFWGISPELVYSRQGLRYKEDDWKCKTRLNYLNIPVLVKLYVLEGLSVDLGPQFGFALNGKNKAKEGGTTVKEKITHLNTFEMGFAMGLSYCVDDFILSARYNLGLSNAFDKKWVGDKNNKNHVFQLSVGYCLNNLF